MQCIPHLAPAQHLLMGQLSAWAGSKAAACKYVSKKIFYNCSYEWEMLYLNTAGCFSLCGTAFGFQFSQKEGEGRDETPYLTQGCCDGKKSC